MVDDSDDPAPDGSQRRNRPSKVKYMQMLQEVADRIRTEVPIDLNDLDAVRRAFSHSRGLKLMYKSGRKLPWTTNISIS